MGVKVDEVSKNEKKMIEEFQCAGCVVGSGIDCGQFELGRLEGAFRPFSCKSHCPGTMIGDGRGMNRIILGLPKGFCEFGDVDMGGPKKRIYVRLFVNKDCLPKDAWNDLNVAVWAIVQDDYLFVRTYTPRSNKTYVDVIKGGTLDMVPQAFDVSKIMDKL